MIQSKFTCSIPNYPRDVQVSAKRLTQYWKEGEANIPKKYKNYLSEKGFLVDPAGNKVVKNPLTAGTPRTVTINAQSIYVGLHHSVRSKIVTELHKLFHDEFKKQLPAKIDLSALGGTRKVLIALHFYDVYNNKLPDLDNLANLFVKCGIDCLTTANHPNQTKGGATHKLGIIPDDKALFIPYILYEYTPVADVKDRKLDFNIYVVEQGFSLEALLDTECEHYNLSKICLNNQIDTSTQL